MSETLLTNEEKRLVYATLKVKLKVALQQEFYLEALLLEYSILEDRLTSILRHSGLPFLTKKKKREMGMEEKLNSISSAIQAQRKPIYRKIEQELIDDIMEWKEVRNALVHRSCQRLYNSDEVKDCALVGNELVRRVNNSASVIKHAVEKMDHQ